MNGIAAPIFAAEPFETLEVKAAEVLARRQSVSVVMVVYMTGAALEESVQCVLKDPLVASTLPNIYNEKQLTEFATISECPELTDEEMDQIAALYTANFGVEDELPPKFKGTMELAETR